MTTKADTSVKWFHSGMADAPVLRGEAGALIELLDACLISGFSTRSPDSVVVAGGVATVSISAGNPYDKHAVIAISGASEPALNAEWRIDTSAASSFTFLCPGVADGTVTGAALKRAGAGWGKPFADTNVAVYQSLDPASTQLYLRVNDADARYTRVRGYEQMTDANTGTGLFPMLTDIPDASGLWVKSAAATTDSRPWVLVADGSMLYLLIRWSGTYNRSADVFRFGDIVSLADGDSYNCVLSGTNTSAPAYPGGNLQYNSPNTTAYMNYGGGSAVARPSSQVAGAIPSCRAALFVAEAGGVAAGSDVVFSEVWEFDALSYTSSNTSATLPRGKSPGYYLAVNKVAELPDMGVIEREDDAQLIALANRGTNTADFRYVAFDVKGPWR